MDKQIWVIGLEGSGTRWVADILGYVVPKQQVAHISLPRFYAGEGRYIHLPYHCGHPQDGVFVIVTRDVTCCTHSNLPHNGGSLERAFESRDLARAAICEYLTSPICETHIWSYETSMYLQDAYTHPLIYAITGKPFPAWNRKINYNDGNEKYIESPAAPRTGRRNPPTAE
jgi:hypothetical protein